MPSNGQLVSALTTVALIALAITAFVSFPLIPRLWWSACGSVCRHHWRSASGSRYSDDGLLYECIDCDHDLVRKDDVWPPTCGKNRTGCGWPHCIPVKELGGVGELYRCSWRRQGWQFMDERE